MKASSLKFSTSQNLSPPSPTSEYDPGNEEGLGAKGFELGSRFEAKVDPMVLGDPPELELRLESK